MGLTDREQQILDELEKQFEKRRRVRVPASVTKAASPITRLVRAPHHRLFAPSLVVVGFVVMTATLRDSVLWSFVGFLMLDAGLVLLPWGIWGAVARRRFTGLVADAPATNGQRPMNDPGSI